MAAPRNNSVFIICIFATAAVLAGLTAYVWGPRFALEFILLSLFCPGYNVLGSACSTGSLASYFLPWSILLTATVLTGFGIRSLWRAARQRIAAEKKFVGNSED